MSCLVPVTYRNTVSLFFTAYGRRGAHGSVIWLGLRLVRISIPTDVYFCPRNEIRSACLQPGLRFSTRSPRTRVYLEYFRLRSLHAAKQCPEI